MTTRKALAAAALAAALTLSLACRQAEQEDSVKQPGATPQAARPAAPTGGAPLRLALLPVLDVLPFFAAEQEGYFTEEGVAVKALPVSSALERDQLLQAGEADGFMGELAAAAFFNRQDTRLKVVMTARKSYADAPVFRILAAPRSDIATPQDLAGVPVAISENTIIEYITDRLLQAEGLDPSRIASQSVPAIPERFQLLMEGKIPAATLPDPLAQSAMAAGAAAVVDDSAHPEFAVTILAFSTDALERDQESIRRFLRAWARGASDINGDPEAYRGLLLQKVRVPKNVQETYVIPPFPIGEIPTVQQWEDVVAWLRDKGLLEGESPYGRSVTAELLPHSP